MAVISFFLHETKDPGGKGVFITYRGRPLGGLTPSSPYELLSLMSERALKVVGTLKEDVRPAERGLQEAGLS